MSTLILPCAGKSSRFPNLAPKWMLCNDNGKSMIEMVIEPLIDSFKNIYISFTYQQEEQYRCSQFLKTIFKDKVRLCCLPKETRSASETIYNTVKQNQIIGEIVIKDSDCIIDYDLPSFTEYIVGAKVSPEINRLEAKSFIIKKQADLICDIIEKKIVSEYICVGAYSCFAGEFCNSYEKIVNSHVYTKDREIFVSYVLSYMILKNKNIFNYVDANKFVDFGTLEDWEKNKNG